MAATVTSAWAKPGAWALDSEEHEEELKQETTQPPSATAAAAMSDFPDLMTAASTKTKKKKGQAISLGEFVSGKPVVSRGYEAPKGLTTEDMMMLPTGPRQRTAEELDRTRLGGGFRSYGNDSSNSRWGSGGGRVNGDDEGGRKSIREPLGPSRADEIDDWGAAKKSSSSSFSIGDRKERGGSSSFFEGSNSRADESDSWGSNKKAQPLVANGGGGGGGSRRMGFESVGDADNSDNWSRKKEAEPRRFGAFDSLRERRLDSDTWGGGGGGKRRDEVATTNVGSRPKLNLQPRKTQIPVGDAVAVVSPGKPKGCNPFGDARPREHVLQEKGEDWKEMDQKLEAMKVKDSASVDRFKTIPKSNEELSWRKNLPSSDKNNENGHTKEPEPEPESEDAQN